jgi:hypothetical protein
MYRQDFRPYLEKCEFVIHFIVPGLTIVAETTPHVAPLNSMNPYTHLICPWETNSLFYITHNVTVIFK